MVSHPLPGDRDDLKNVIKITPRPLKELHPQNYPITSFKKQKRPMKFPGLVPLYKVPPRPQHLLARRGRFELGPLLLAAPLEQLVHSVAAVQSEEILIQSVLDH